ncbi:MAG: thymidine phosphorylase [Candidatus Eisenbacteria bacterium]
MAVGFDARRFLRDRRDAKRHPPEDLRAFVDAVVHGGIETYQTTAWLMAAYLNELDDEETFALTDAMMRSGTVITFDDLPGPTVDKHSTGGVGDKISLPLAPLVAACGAFVPMISGRGLGHTGGTLDKLESIPGFDPRLSVAAFKAQTRRLGLAFGAQTAELAPADGVLYSLRDVTATVETIPLIVASILSKKYASGTAAVVFDVKTGRGAFMRELERSKALAERLIAVSGRMGRRATALVTDMEQPLGRAVGNALEVVESIEVLRGGGPPDVRALTLALAAEMLVLASIDAEPAAALERATRALDGGRALEKFRAVVEAQGGDPRTVDDPALLARAARTVPVTAAAGGFVAAIDAYAVGEAIVALGGGRRRAEDAIDPAVGIVFDRKVGDAVQAGETMAVVHAGTADPAGVVAALAAAIAISPEAPPPQTLVRARLE